MITALNEDHMRVTSIPYRSTKMVIFIDVPRAKDSYKTNSGKYYVTIKADPDQLPTIGCGKVLADIVEEKTAANTMLDIVKRQEGSTGIPEYSKLIN